MMVMGMSLAMVVVTPIAAATLHTAATAAKRVTKVMRVTAEAMAMAGTPRTAATAVRVDMGATRVMRMLAMVVMEATREHLARGSTDKSVNFVHSEAIYIHVCTSQSLPLAVVPMAHALNCRTSEH